MITATFKLAGQQVSIKIEGNSLSFFDVNTGMVSTIEGLKLSKSGVIKEHPDLEDNEDWRKIAIKRLKEYMKKIKTEMEKIIYVKDELRKSGYSPLFYQKKGWRVKKFKTNGGIE